MKQSFTQIAVGAVLLLVFCLLCRLTPLGDYHAYLPMPYGGRDVSAGELQVLVDAPEVLSAGEMRQRNGYLQVPLRPVGAGEARLEVPLQGGASLVRYYSVGPLGTVYDHSTGGFSGDSVVLVAVTLFWLLTGLVMLRQFLRSRGPAFCSYSTLFAAGFALFALSCFPLMLFVTVSHLLAPEECSMLDAYGRINGAPLQFMMLTLLPVAAFAVSMAVSNIALLRHETPRPQNLLGLLISLLLLAGEGLGVLLFTLDFSGPEWMSRLFTTLENLYGTVFAYFECMLAASVLCGLMAAGNEPKTDKDFILILGCWFRPDGTLPPLLRGRVDRAVAFWRKQKALTGKEAYLIPTGGQGKNETMTEAEAMKRCLLSLGIPEERILTEDKARNTFQNMAYSRQIISSVLPEGKTAFATTNYHVFRSGVWASLAGLEAEGMGSRTKWWFWPNAFMRECAGLLKNRWKEEVLLLIGFLVFFILLSLVL